MSTTTPRPVLSRTLATILSAALLCGTVPAARAHPSDISEASALSMLPVAMVVAAHAAAATPVADRAELLRPTLVHPGTLSEATQVAYPDLAGILPGIGPQSPNDWGLGFEIRGYKTPHWTGRTNSPATYGHFGASGTFLWVDPVVERSLLVLTDRNFGPWADRKSVV